jgi:UTP--glucose-1-phosphate uridylyltransferase
MNTNNIEDIISRRMAKRGIRQQDIDFFLAARHLMDDVEKKVNWNEIAPLSKNYVPNLPEKGSGDYLGLKQYGKQFLNQCAVVKLNGGRSTTMGGQVPKCMVEAKNGMSFLDIVMHQVMAANDQNGVEMPLILMNSFFTDHVTEKIVGRTPLIIMNFIQNEYPRIREDNYMPLDTGGEMDWCPAGHGDFYTSFYGSGLVESLLELGLRYVFVSNIDNLSAEISPVLLGAMITEHRDFLMEVTPKTVDDVKGGAPVFYKNRLSLLEIAQIPEKHLAEFQDIERFRYFNTNNLWIDLRSLKKVMDERSMQLPVIQNKKTINGTNIIQIETAMGAALSCFDRPGLLNVPRFRFAPVKTIADLERLQSDECYMDKQYKIRRRDHQTLALD